MSGVRCVVWDEWCKISVYVRCCVRWVVWDKCVCEMLCEMSSVRWVGRSPFWRLWVLRLPRGSRRGPAATPRAAAPSGGSMYCACHCGPAPSAAPCVDGWVDVDVLWGSRLTCDPIPDLTCDPILNPPKVASLTTLFPASLATLFLGTNARS